VPTIEEAPRPAPGRHFVSAYGDGGFRVAGRAWRGSILIFPAETRPWPVADMAELVPESLAALDQPPEPVELLLLGCGPRLVAVPDAVRASLRRLGVVVEAMDTGAACRTYNVLLAEGRRVAAALIAVD